MTTIIECNGIASATFVISEDEWSVAYVTSLWVHSKHRRKKWGSWLLIQLARHLVQQRVWNIKLDTVLDKSNDFYEKLGFVYSAIGDNEMKIKTFALSEKVVIVPDKSKLTIRKLGTNGFMNK